MCGTPWTSLERHPGGNLICKSGVRGEILVGALWKRRRHKGSIKKQKAIEEAEGRLLCLLEPPEQPSVAPPPRTLTLFLFIAPALTSESLGSRDA